MSTPPQASARDPGAVLALRPAGRTSSHMKTASVAMAAAVTAVKCPENMRPNSYTMKDTAYASPVWYPTAMRVHRALPISLRIAPIAATQGKED